MSRVTRAFIVASTVAASITLTSCSSTPGDCGVGTELPEDAVYNFLTAVVENDAEIACHMLPSGTTPEQVQQEIDHYRGFGLTEQEIDKITGEQMGLGYSAALNSAAIAEADTPHLILILNTRGRWIWAKDYWTVIPVTYSIPPDGPVDSTPSSEVTMPAS